MYQACFDTIFICLGKLMPIIALKSGKMALPNTYIEWISRIDI